MSTSGPTHRNVASIRSPPNTNTGAPPSPHTPLRTVSSAFGSPSALRAEEDNVIIELGSRYFRAGFAGDAFPKAVIDFGPEGQRRAGDYRKWEVGYDKEWRKRMMKGDWGEGYELWKPDLRELDLGLVADKIDRAMREAFAKYLLLDSRPRRFTLVIPSALPRPLLSTILDTLFTNFQPPTISLMSSAALTTVAGGLRSALVVDIGWAETVITSICEYREVQTTRSIRATKWLGEEMFRMLAEEVDPSAFKQEFEEAKLGEQARRLVSFDECEEVITRMAWCKPGKRSQPKDTFYGLAPVKEEDELRASMRSLRVTDEGEADPITSIPLVSTDPPKTLKIPFSRLAEPCEETFFATGTPESDLDDEETPLHLLVYRSLLNLPIDVRSICMARVVFVGGGSKLPGLKQRVLDELGILIEKRGWDRVQGKAVEQFRNNPKLRRTQIRQPDDGPTEVPKISGLPASQQKHDPDPIDESLRREVRKHSPPVDSGNVRGIESLGAWSGGSLLTQLKIPAIAVIDREQWIQQGAAGASRAGEVSVAASNRQSMAPGAFKSGVVERSSWTLGLWG